MKKTLPLPIESEQKFISKEIVGKLDIPFCHAVIWNIPFTQSDMDYIENTIKAHRLYRVVNENYKHIYRTGNDYLRSLTTIAQFFDQFVNDKKCPANLKRLLNLYILHLKGSINRGADSEHDAALMGFFENRWMEKCR